METQCFHNKIWEKKTKWSDIQKYARIKDSQKNVEKEKKEVVVINVQQKAKDYHTPIESNVNYQSSYNNNNQGICYSLMKDGFDYPHIQQSLYLILYFP